MTCKTRIARFAIGAALGVSVLTGLPTLSVADTSSELQSQLDEASSHLNDLYSQASDLGQDLLQTQEDLDSTNAEIAQKQTELSQAQDTLAGRVSTNYKTGGVSLASIIFESNSFDDLVNRIYYASKVSESDAQTIQQVKDIQNELDQKKSEQQQLLADQQSQKDDLDAKTSEAETYVSSLDQQVQDKLAEEQAAYEAQQKAAQEAAQQQARQDGGYVTEQDVAGGSAESGTANNGGNESNGGAGNQGSANTDTTDNAGSQETPTSPSKPSKPSKPSNNGSSNGNSGSSSGLTQSQRDAIVSAAWSKVGGPYVYGGTGPVGYDCSGFVRYCYAQAGISLPRTSESQGCWGKSTSNPQKGDIVCWGGHVGIYMGGGMMIDAGNERVGISYRAVYGSPWYRTKA